MSSVSSADRRSQADDLRSQREDYENREIDQAKRHKKEIKRILERHDKEVTELKDTFEKQMGTLKERSNKNLTDKDIENQAKIDKLRAMYSESLRKKTEESNSRRDAELQTLRNQIEKNTAINEQQKDILRRNFTDSIAEKDRVLADVMTRSKSEMDRAITRSADKLGNRHKNEMKALTDDRDERLMKARQDQSQSKSMYENRLKDQDRNNRLKMDQTESNWMENYNNKQNEMNEILTGKNQALAMTREKIRNDYKNALDKKLNELDGAHQTLKDQVASRLDSDVRSAENENKRLKSDHIVEMMTTKRVRDLEKDHVIMDYENRMGKLTAQKDGLIDKANEVNREKIDRVNNQNQNVVRELVTRNKDDARIAKERHQEDRARLEMEKQSEIQHLSNSTGDRVDKLMKATNQAQVIQQKQHKENLDALKTAYADELGNQREVQTEQLKNTYMRMDQRLKDTENKMGKRMEETVNAYEAKIAEIKDNYEKEIKKQSEAYEKRLENQKKLGQTDQKSQDMKFDIKLGQLQEQHEKEVERLQKRHQEQMASLAQKMNYYRKS